MRQPTLVDQEESAAGDHQQPGSRLGSGGIHRDLAIASAENIPPEDIAVKAVADKRIGATVDE
jgi:hypothetical protein